MADYLISRALTGEEMLDAKCVHNYVLGSRPEPLLPPRLLANSGKRPQAPAAPRGARRAPASRAGDVSYFRVCMWEGWEDGKKSEKVYVSKYFKEKRGKLVFKQLYKIIDAILPDPQMNNRLHGPL